MNKCILSGFIGKKGIELKYAGDKPVATFSLSIPTKVKGEYVFANIVAWNKQAEFLKNNEDRIKSLIIDCRFNSRSYEGNNGKVYVNEFIANEVEVKEWNNDGQAAAKPDDEEFTEVDSEEVPF